MPFTKVTVIENVYRADSGCWIWQKCVNSAGCARYGNSYAHRLSYELYVGPIPKKFVIDHLCRTPRCINPMHLEAVTPRENCLRGLKGVLKEFCRNGHPYKGNNVWVNNRGDRQCRLCSQNRNKNAAFWRTSKGRKYLRARFLRLHNTEEFKARHREHQHRYIAKQKENSHSLNLRSV